MYHRHCFAVLYTECKKGPDSFLKFQLRWHQHCSVFLLSSRYPVSAIKLQELPNFPVDEVRKSWLDFCEASGLPVPESNSLMIMLSSVIYELLLDYAANFQSSLEAYEGPSSSVMPDGDDVYYRFGGAAISDMLHIHYKQLKACANEHRDILSQEVSLLQAINSKDKTIIPGYLQYRDQ